MGHGYKSGAGGGTSLNFKVVGNPKPISPRENTIWLDTDVPITGWIFSATEPSAPEYGIVWFSIGTSSTVAFNALKKNGIQVYPLSAKQHVDGEWVSVLTQSYQDGEWTAWWNGELYKLGYEYENITGGWIAQKILVDTAVSTFTKGDSSITIKTLMGQSSAFTPSKKIDLTDISTLYANIVDFSGGGSGYKAFGVSDSFGKAPTGYSTIRETGLVTFDTSNLKGEYVVGFFTNANTSAPVVIEFDEVRME